MAGKIIVSTLQSDTDNSISFVANTGATIFSANISHGIAGSFIANGSITGAKIALGTITGDDIATGQITGNLLTANCVSGNNIVSSPTITGNVTINGSLGIGGATPASSGVGITFPATQSASTDANTLDDYEEGTWTPTVTPGSGSLTSYTSSGIYVKIGRFVQVVGSFTITNAGTAGGYGAFGGLPFTAIGPSTAYRQSLGTGREDANTGTFYQVQVGPGSGVWRITTAADGPITWTTNYDYIFTMTYQTA